MVEGEIKVTTKSMFGYALFILGLILLGYAAVNALCLANGIFQPLRVQIIDPTTGRGLIATVETQVLLGEIMQVGMYGLIIAVASILMKNGLDVARKG